MAKTSKTASKPHEPPRQSRGNREASRRAAVQRHPRADAGNGAHKRDGRTEKRRQRLMRELEQGKVRGSRELKPLDVLQRVNELLSLGEPLSSIRKIAKVRKATVPAESMVEVVSRLHKAYGFRPECYRFVGVGDDVLRSAGVLGAEVPRRARVRKRAA